MGNMNLNWQRLQSWIRRDIPWPNLGSWDQSGTFAMDLAYLETMKWDATHNKGNPTPNFSVLPNWEEIS